MRRPVWTRVTPGRRSVLLVFLIYGMLLFDRANSNLICRCPSSGACMKFAL